MSKLLIINKRVSILLHKATRSSSSQSSSLFNTVNRFGRQSGADEDAIFDANGRHSYRDVAVKSDAVAKALIDENIFNENVSYLCPNDASYTFATFGIWKSGNSCVPLCKSHPAKTMDYYITDSRSRVLIATKNFALKAFPLVKDRSDRKLLILDDIMTITTHNEDEMTSNDDKFGGDQNAMLIYTSGTTGSPKGVVMTHQILNAQIENLVKAWTYSKQDCLLHVLPLHHVHGIVNCLLTPLAVGGRIKMLPDFDARKVWENLLSQDNTETRANLFMAVPTIYAKLIEFFHKNSKSGRFMEKSLEEIRHICHQDIRMMVSGSAALPQPILEEWSRLTSHVLLERYGMTELGMALTNPLEPKARRPGFVGVPFPSVECRIVKEGSDEVLVHSSAAEAKILNENSDLSGDLQVRGPNVFKCYFGKPEATAKEFTKDGWFKTGDTAQFQDGAFKILGRSSVDIIKSGGYKISALDIERILLSHPDLLDVAVVGVNDVTWGQKVGVVVVFKKEELTLQQMRDWSKDLMPSYSLPSLMKVLPELPKNAMGKVNKKELVKIAFPTCDLSS